jgi:hypothetical protein
MRVAKCLASLRALERLAVCRAERGVGAQRPVDVRALRDAGVCARSAMTWHLGALCGQGARRQVSRLRRFGSGVVHLFQLQRHASAFAAGQQGQGAAASAGKILGNAGGIIAFGARSWRQAVRPNTSFKRTRNGMAPGPRRLTIRSTGHFAACGSWASFHSRPTAACRKMPVSSNVRPRHSAAPDFSTKASGSRNQRPLWQFCSRGLSQKHMHLITQRTSVEPNPSFKRSANGRPPGPRGRVAYHRPRGPGVLPSSPA